MVICKQTSGPRLGAREVMATTGGAALRGVMGL
jgi:hypothetical protein